MAASAHSIISDDNFQTSCLPFPPDSPHYAHLIPIGSKGPVPGVATYDNGSCLDAPDNSEKKSTNYTSDPLEESLVVSPYSSRPHLLELKDLDESSRLLARALTVMRHVREDYATAPYAHAFNWQEVMQQFRKVTRGQNIKQWRENMFYIVVFRSRLASGTDPSYIGYLDELSHAEAMKTGGLLKYWFGSPNEERRNLATCIWRSHQDAQLGSAGKGHRQAAKQTASMYEEWKVERYKLVVGEDLEHWQILNWDK